MSDPFDNSGQGQIPPPPPGGSPFGAPGQAASGAQPFQPPTAPTQPAYSNPNQGPTYATTTAVLQPGPDTGPKRSRGKMVGALVGVLALVGAGTFAVTQISSNSSDGGASSPKEVGDKLVKALDGEDLLGAVDLLLPGERETFRQPLVDLSKELGRLQVTDDTVDLNKVPGFDITMAEPVVTVEDTNVKDISRVSVKAQSTVKINGKDLPIGKLLIDRVFNGERPKVDDKESDAEFNVTFDTVQKDGRWYLSLFYSAADAARGGQDIPETGVTPVGASTPDGALDNMINSIGDLDLEGIIAGLNPNEAEALQRYAPLFIDKAQKELDKVDTKIKISGAKYSVTGSGDTRQVGLTAIKVTASADKRDVEIELKDGCLTATSGDTDFNSCSSTDAQNGTIDSSLNSLNLPNTPEFKKLVDDLRTTFSDFQMHGVVVDKVGGKWYVSPIHTSTEFFLSVLRSVDRDEIDTIINDGRAAINSLFDSIGSSDSTTSSGDGSSTDDTVFPDDTSSTGDTTASTDAGESYWFDCLTKGTSADASACIDAGVADGSFTADEIPGPYLYPKCGLFDYYNGQDLYQDSPQVFNATISKGAQCIAAAAAADGLDLTYGSPEFAHPECYTAVNPYNYSGDTDAISAAYNCAVAAG